MSTQAAGKFLEKVASDETLSEKLFSKGGSKQELLDAVVAAGRERGFTFSEHDVGSLLASARRPEAGVLDEHELEQVVGGGAYLNLFKWCVGQAFAGMGAGSGSDTGGGGGGIRG